MKHHLLHGYQLEYVPAPLLRMHLLPLRFLPVLELLRP
ncbi:Uncharacterised protein [Segatella copri]|nr:Uncharacterised protein [Segatella copri]